jgi:hypothetical protein
MTKSHADHQHFMTALLRRELAVAEATRGLNECWNAPGSKQERTSAQAEMLAGVPPITAFMGMEG